MHITLRTLPYVGSLFWIYDNICSLTRGNRSLAKSLTGIIVTASYIAIYGIWLITTPAQSLSEDFVEQVAAILIAYYVMDTYLLINGEYIQDRWMYVTHHCFAIKLIRAHVMGALPMAIGVHYLSLFECSNFFMQLFLMCKQQGWRTAANALMLPFVATYVPIRMFAIPIYSFMYVESQAFWHNVAMLAFVNVFSMYYAGVVLHKFVSIIASAITT